jgi:nitrogen-specific signal transduction histidine kinase
MFEKLELLVIHNRENEGISITFTCEDPDLVLHADEQMITQTMLNLIKNAAQALVGIDHPEILIQANPASDKGVQLSVTDNGPGIASEISDEIFMPFFTTRQKGTGVGLSYSRQVMNMNNGKIEFDSIPGRTEFRLVFVNRI